MMHGIKSIAVVNLQLPVLKTDVVIQVAESDKSSEVVDGINKLLGPLDLKVTDENTGNKFELSDLCNCLFANANFNWLDCMVPLAHMTLNSAYEYCKGMGYVTRDPTWEFLRHCRNAISHNGKINFTGQEPRHPAYWRSISLSPQQNGLQLIKKEGIGLLEAGDPIALLLDIENMYPAVV
ncbi:hypothetical protein [Kangiella sp. M94]